MFTFSLTALSFSAPWVLIGLVFLPVVWWLLRVTPPLPRMITFPPIEFVRKMIKNQQTPARTPWWILVLRLMILTLIILAISGPVYHPASGLVGSGPVIIVIDNGWASAPSWTQRQRIMTDIVDEAQRTARPVVLLPTTIQGHEDFLSDQGLISASQARSRIQTLSPHPWPVDYHAALETLLTIPITGAAHTVWLSNGLTSPGLTELVTALQHLGRVEMLIPSHDDFVYLLTPPTLINNELKATIHRATDTFSTSIAVALRSADHRILERVYADFAEQSSTAVATFTIPAELYPDMSGMTIDDQNSAGATILLDNRWHRPLVGLVEGCQLPSSQPLLTSHHYLEQALTPYATVRKNDLDTFLESNVSVMILADLAPLQDNQIMALEQWIKDGGTLIRFAGPCLANNVDALVPVSLRIGDRHLGGALSWSQPGQLAPFASSTPFAGLTIPDDVLIHRQVLAQPTFDLESKSWAHLIDGTPLVTADRRGSGWLILIHTTVTPQWSDLSLSGLFVQMLRRLIALGMRSTIQTNDSLVPLSTLDGFGQLEPAPSSALAIDSRVVDEVVISHEHPPGYYGTQDYRRAINLGSQIDPPRPIDSLPSGVIRKDFKIDLGFSLVPWLLVGTFLLILIDLLISLMMRGYLRPLPFMTRSLKPSIRPMLFMIGSALIIIYATPAMADQDLEWQRSLKIYLAYIQTDDPALNRTAHAGLIGLSKVVNQRTTIDIAGVVSVDLETPIELAFFPLIYWSLSPTQPLLSSAARVQINQYLRNGGMILFDTRGHYLGTQTLQRLTQDIDLPALQPIPADHTLTRSFYLLRDFPGRYRKGMVWVAHQERVSSVIIGANDWVAAWAIDNVGNPLFAVIPGGEQQRETAYRFGINLMMYVLTGDYKSDQVHLSTIMERLSQ